MSGKKIQILLNLNAPVELDDEEKERVTRQLRDELLGLDVNSIDFAKSGKATAKAKAGDPVSWGTLLITLAASGGVLTTVIGVIQSWLTRHNQRSMSLEINGNKLEIKGISSKEQKQLINTWINAVLENKP